MAFNRTDAEMTNQSYSEISPDFCKYDASNSTISEGGYVENTDYTKDSDNNISFITKGTASGDRPRAFRYLCAETGGVVEIENSRGEMVQKTLPAGVVRPCMSNVIGANTAVDVIVYF